MKIAFIYGGQGSQVEGMGRDLYESYPFVQDFYDSIQLDFPLKELAFQGDLETISKTEYTQGILLAFQIAATKVLAEYGIRPNIAMGLSLGEYAALYAADSLDDTTLLKIIEFRSRQMAKAAQALDSKMLAVFSDDLEGLEELCKVHSKREARVEVSNINTKGQIVLSGDAQVIKKIGEALKSQGYKFKELNTSGPFHTSYMDPVEKSLMNLFQTIEFKTPQIPIIHNLYGRLQENIHGQDSDLQNPEHEELDNQEQDNQEQGNQEQGNQEQDNQEQDNQEQNKQEKDKQEKQPRFDLKETMAKQVNHPVLFKSSLEELLEQKPDLILEIGYSNVIKGLMKRIDKSVKVISINTVESIEEFIQSMK